MSTSITAAYCIMFIHYNKASMDEFPYLNLAYFCCVRYMKFEIIYQKVAYLEDISCLAVKSQLMFWFCVSVGSLCFSVLLPCL